MSKNIYVGNLAYGVTDQDLEELFKPFGSVISARTVSDKYTGRSKGFGFVEMENADEAQTAIDALNGKDVQGRTITVNEARPKTDRPAGGGRGGWSSKSRY